jgi:hypothetical protein
LSDFSFPHQSCCSFEHCICILWKYRGEITVIFFTQTCLNLLCFVEEICFIHEFLTQYIWLKYTKWNGVGHCKIWNSILNSIDYTSTEGWRLFPSYWNLEQSVTAVLLDPDSY